MAQPPKVPRTPRRAPQNTKDDAGPAVAPPSTTTTAAAAAAASTTDPTLSAKPTPAPAQMLETILNWLHAVDNWSVAGYQNKLPRWVYLVAAVIIINVL